MHEIRRFKLCDSFSCSGEFTLRAFLNGRLDLSQAENVAKLISAKSVAAADAALAGIQACLFLKIILCLSAIILLLSFVCVKPLMTGTL